MHLVGFTIETLEVSGVEGKMNISPVDRVQGRSSDFVAHSHKAICHWFCGSQRTLGHSDASARNTDVRTTMLPAVSSAYGGIISAIWLIVMGGGGGKIDHGY